MWKLTLALMTGLVLVSNFAQAELFRNRTRLISRTQVSENDPAEAVLRVTNSYPAPAGLAYDPQPTLADGLPPMPSPTPIITAPPTAPENAVVQAYTLPVAPAMYQNVRVRQARKAHPCAVPMLVAVQDPCNPCCQVCVEVCVPPCAVAEIRCKRCSNGVVYDFGKYEVEIKSRGDLLIVDYDR